MVFPFTFSFRLPGIINPFALSSTDPLAPPPNKQEGRPHQSPVGRQHPSQALSRTIPPPPPPPLGPVPIYPIYPSAYPIPIASSVGTRRISRADLPKINRPRPSPSPSPSPAVLSRKRGWEPDPSPSWSTTSLTLASTSGYLDTPAKYREMAGNEEFTTNSDHDFHYTDNRHVDDDMPPLKKRRGLAGSIVSTAVSAALIGTAVGLTVYRLWRDRGKEAQIQAAEHNISESPDPSTQPPPPPYQESEWKPLPQPAPIQVSSSVTATPRTVARRKRHAAAASKRPVVVYHPTRRSRQTPASSSSTPAQPEFDFGREEGEEEGIQSVVEDKMDWIGDKLSMLIEQGKRALNTEVVVMSDAKEDEVDDGSGAWEEDDDDVFSGRQYGRSTPSSRAGSIKRAKKPRNIVPPSASSEVGLGLYGVNASGSSTSLLSVSPRRAGYQATYNPSPPSTSTTYASASAGFAPSSSLPRNTLLFDTPRSSHVRGLSYESALTASSATREDAVEWESPEIRESMERARARLLARRAGGGGV